MKSLLSFQAVGLQILLPGISHEQFMTAVSLHQEILLRGREKVYVKNCI